MRNHKPLGRGTTPDGFHERVVEMPEDGFKLCSICKGKGEVVRPHIAGVSVAVTSCTKCGGEGHL